MAIVDGDDYVCPIVLNKNLSSLSNNKTSLKKCCQTCKTSYRLSYELLLDVLTFLEVSPFIIIIIIFFLWLC